jgi:hypothetical protein
LSSALAVVELRHLSGENGAENRLRMDFAAEISRSALLADLRLLALDL